MVEEARATVFYSWQSDLPNSVNRGFIQQALEGAAKAIRNDDSIEVEPVVERDTQNVPGSPQIADAIFDKIAAADVFVADVSFIANGKRPRKGSRPCPNPNVLVELGYAARAIGWDRIVLVMNAHFGRVERLPFDLRMRRTLSYAAAPGDADKGIVRRDLQGRLESALREILLRRSPRATKPSVIDVAVASIEAAKPDQAAASRDLMRQFCERLVEVAPRGNSVGQPDDALVKALSASIPSLVDFGRVAEAASRHGAREAVLAIAQGFGQLLERYRFPPRQGGSFMDTDFDLFKFAGHEAFVMLTAALLRHERWDLLALVLNERFSVERNGGSRTEGFHAISTPVKLLEIRNERLSLRRICHHGDALKERHEKGPLEATCSFKDFLDADWLLFLRSDLAADASPMGTWGAPLWRPWSCIYAEAHGLPQFLARAEQKAFAERLVPALGLATVDQFKTRYRERAGDLAAMFRSRGGFFEPPVLDPDRIGTV
jgi:hypothetical protein